MNPLSRNILDISLEFFLLGPVLISYDDIPTMTQLELYSKSCVKWPFSKRPKIGFQDQLSLNAGHAQIREHSAILSTYIKPQHHLPLRSLFCLFLRSCFTQAFTIIRNIF